MTAMRVAALFALAVAFASGHAVAQTPPDDAPSWTVSASAATYMVADDKNYVQPTVAVDRDWLHLEGRFNYEDRNTGSAWFGRNFEAGSTVTLEIAPMIGVAFGRTAGVAPGYKGTLQWRVLDLYSEGEYLFDTGNSSDSFLYTWSEVGVSPRDWLRAGFAVQRTRVYQTELDTQRGLFAGVSFRRANISAYVFDSGGARPTVVLSVGASF